MLILVLGRLFKTGFIQFQNIAHSFLHHARKGFSSNVLYSNQILETRAMSISALCLVC